MDTKNRYLEKCNDSERRVLVSLNPKAGRTDSHDKVDYFSQVLEQNGLETEIITQLDELDEKATQAKKDGTLRTVVAAGGDGTASLLAGMFSPEIPITLLPLGTENLLAKYLLLNDSVDDVAQAVLDGNKINLDCGRANGKLFLVMASCGFDADVVRRLHKRRTGHIHHLSYAKPIIKSIANYRYPKLTITMDDEEPFHARWAFVFNVPRYAMRLPIAENASATDGLLDICTFRRGNLLNGLKYLAGVILRKHHKFSGTRSGRAKKITIDAGKKIVPFQLDGDPGGQLPVTIEILPEFLNIIVPQKWLAKYADDITQETTSVN